MFSGSLVAILTPLNHDGSVDKSSLKKLINYHINSGTSAIVVMGTTGESATLYRNEQYEIIGQVLDYADNKIPVIASIAANATAKAVLLTRKFEALGIAGCLSVTPYYNKPTQEGLFQHYQTIAENTVLPQILYNVPSRTGCDLLPETVGRLAKIKNIVALKEATGDLARVYKLRRLVGEKFYLLSGDDTTFLDFMILGGDGIISVTANIAAPQMAKICQLAQRRCIREAREANERLLSLHHALFVESNPIPVKWAAAAMGLITTPTMRLPLTSLSENAKGILEKALEIAKLT